MASNAPGYLEYSDSLFLGQDFTVRIITIETTRLYMFCSLTLAPEKFKLRNTKSQKVDHSKFRILVKSETNLENGCLRKTV